jgi:hypothetical protein
VDKETEEIKTGEEDILEITTEIGAKVYQLLLRSKRINKKRRKRIKRIKRIEKIKRIERIKRIKKR